MKFSKSKKIDESKIRIKKTISLFAKTISGDWKILIGALAFIFLVGLGFTWNLYRTVSSQSFLNDSQVVEKAGLKINTAQLDRVMENLNSKKEKFNSLTGQN